MTQRVAAYSEQHLRIRFPWEILFSVVYGFLYRSVAVPALLWLLAECCCYSKLTLLPRDTVHFQIKEFYNPVTSLLPPSVGQAMTAWQGMRCASIHASIHASIPLMFVCKYIIFVHMLCQTNCSDSARRKCWSESRQGFCLQTYCSHPESIQQAEYFEEATGGKFGPLSFFNPKKCVWVAIDLFILLPNLGPSLCVQAKARQSEEPGHVHGSPRSCAGPRGS